MIIYIGSQSWFEASESITHIHGEDNVRQVVELPTWARMVMKEEDAIWIALKPMEIVGQVV